MWAGCRPDIPRCRHARDPVPSSAQEPQARPAGSSSSTRRPPWTAAATPPSAASATSSRSPPTSSATATTSCARSCATRRPAAAALAEAPLEPRSTPTSTACAGPAASRSTAAGRWEFTIEAWTDAFAHLARRARAQDRRRPARPRGRDLRGRRAARAGRRARRRTRPTARLIEHARGVLADPDDARDRQARRRARPRAVRRRRAPSRPLVVHARCRAAAARGRPRARPLRRLVRAVPALLGRPARRRRSSCRGSPTLGFDVSTCRRSTRSARTNRKGRNNALIAGARRPRVAVGDRGRGAAATRRSTPSSARSRTCARCAPPPTATASTSRSTGRSSARADHPWLTQHPEWFHRRPDGTLKYAENPPKRYQDIYNVNWDSPGLARAVGRAARDHAPLGRRSA